MNEKKNDNVLKTLVVILGVCLIALLIYTFNFYRTNTQNISALHQEKELLQNELKGIKENYDEMLAENSELKDDLKIEQRRVRSLLDSLEEMEVNYQSLAKFRVQTSLLKNEKKRLAQIVDSLSEENKQLKSEVDSTATVLKNHMKYTDSLGHKNRELSEKIKKASVLQISDLIAGGSVYRNDKEAFSTQKASLANKIKACFTLLDNPLIEPGKRELYIQVINPKNNLLGSSSTVKYNSQVLRYSAHKEIIYENKKIEICLGVDAKESDILPGRYVINIFDGPNLVGSSDFNLK